MWNLVVRAQYVANASVAPQSRLQFEQCRGATMQQLLAFSLKAVMKQFAVSRVRAEKFHVRVSIGSRIEEFKSCLPEDI